MNDIAKKVRYSKVDRGVVESLSVISVLLASFVLYGIVHSATYAEPNQKKVQVMKNNYTQMALMKTINPPSAESKQRYTPLMKENEAIKRTLPLYFLKQADSIQKKYLK